METILLPTDGSPAAETAIDHAVMLAERMDATVHGVYSVHLPPAADYDLGFDVGSVESALEEDGEAALAIVEQACENAGVAFEGHLRAGRPATEIETLANEIETDLIVIGTQGASGLSRLLLGSTTIEVLRRGPHPVLVIPGDAAAPDDGYDGILVGTDASPASEAASDLAINWATALDTSLHALFVVETAYTHSAEVEATLEELGAGALQTLEERATEAGVKITTAIDTGIAHAVLSDYARNHDIDLLVVGSHGRGSLERTFLGSVSERTVRTADRPVLVTR